MKKQVLIAAALLLSLSTQAGTIVKWGESGGDTGIVTKNANGAVTTSYTDTYVSPADGVNGYDLGAAGQTRKYYGAMDPKQVFGINQNNGGDRIQMVKNFGGAGGTITSMIAWESPDFLLTGTGGLESFSMEFDTRGGATTASFLIETAAGWYQSDQTFADADFSTVSNNVADLTWSPFSLFGVAGGVGVADTNDVVSVGAYFTSTLPSGNWSGALLRYFEVVAEGGEAWPNQPPDVDDQSVWLVENTSLDITLTGTDPEGSNVTYTVVDTPTNGVLTGTAPNLTYTPNADYVGPDSFTFTGSDGETNSAPATISIDVVEDRTVWENDMSASPIGDGWIYRGGTGTSTVTNGVLIMTADGTRIDSAPPNDFLGVTKLELQWRALNVTTDGRGRAACCWINVAGSAPQTAALNFHAALEANGTQTFRILNGATQFHEVTGFSTNMLTLAATIDGDLAVIDYIIGDGTTSVTSSVPFVANSVTEITPSIATMLSFGTVVSEFDYIRIEANWSLEKAYENWADFYGLDGDDASLETDVEPDGLNNLLEYALGGNPTNDDAAAVLPGSFVAMDGGSNWLYQVYNQSTDPTLTFTEAASPNLVMPSWDTNDVFFVGESAVVDAYKSVTNRTGVSSDAKFIKLDVSK